MKKPVIHHYSGGGTAELTDENIHAFDDKTQMAYLALREVEGKELLTEKYYQGFKTTIRYDWMNEFRRVNPEMPTNLVVAKIIERLPNFIPGDKLVELTKFAVDEWEKIKENQAMEMAA